MIKIKKTRDGATLTFGKTTYHYIWNEFVYDDFKKMFKDIKDLLGVPAAITIYTETPHDEDNWPRND